MAPAQIIRSFRWLTRLLSDVSQPRNEIDYCWVRQFGPLGHPFDLVLLCPLKPCSRSNCPRPRQAPLLLAPERLEECRRPHRPLVSDKPIKENNLRTSVP